MEKLQKSDDFDIELLKIPLERVNEPFVSLEALNRIGGDLVAFNDYLQPEQRYLREGVARALFSAATDFMVAGYRLELLSAYRSLNWQRQLFRARVEETRALRGDGPDEAELLRAANTFTAGIPLLAAHTAGSAVDIRLLDRQGTILDFGTDYREQSDLSHTFNPDNSEEVLANRQLLSGIMADNGFANYPYEWWHYSIGDVCWAYLRAEPSAMYAPAEYDPATQELTDYEGDLYSFFV